MSHGSPIRAFTSHLNSGLIRLHKRVSLGPICRRRRAITFLNPALSAAGEVRVRGGFVPSVRAGQETCPARFWGMIDGRVKFLHCAVDGFNVFCPFCTWEGWGVVSFFCVGVMRGCRFWMGFLLGAFVVYDEFLLLFYLGSCEILFFRKLFLVLYICCA